jgi:hypothetical protein
MDALDRGKAAVAVAAALVHQDGAATHAVEAQEGARRVVEEEGFLRGRPPVVQDGLEGFRRGLPRKPQKRMSQMRSKRRRIPRRSSTRSACSLGAF